jgi:hypothetical protein
MLSTLLEHFTFDGGLLAVVTGSVEPGKGKWMFFPGAPTEGVPEGEVYFGPAQRKARGNKKEDILGTRALWVDVDSPQRPTTTLPYSAAVWSGHGWHLYWFLEEPLKDIELIESYNKLLVTDTAGGDMGCWNVNRFMRVPGSVNLKDPNDPIKVEVKKLEPDLKYAASDFKVLVNLEKATRHRIRTGDSRGFQSRSERDWSIVTSLVKGGASEKLIQKIFENQPCGDKFHEDGGDEYLNYTISRAASRTQEGGAKRRDLEVREDGYYSQVGRSIKRVSTFTILPTYLIDGTILGGEDAIVGDVSASGHTWSGITFTRTAFTAVHRFDRETPIAAWQWLGRDEEVRMLLPHLLKELSDKGMPRIVGVPRLGLFQYKDKWYFVGNKGLWSEEAYFEGHSGPLGWIPTQREHPVMEMGATKPSDEFLEAVAKGVPALNEPGVIWPMIGWFAASIIKPWLEQQRYRFPVLNVSGTKGSGKTTLLQNIFMPLFGQSEPKSYDARTTRFVVLSVLGSTNAIPVAFSEFRSESVSEFIRYILLAYDTGHDPRGRSDQTTVDYPLTAPFSVDGEDVISDPAARERILVAALHPKTVEEKGPYWNAYQSLISIISPVFASYYIPYTLQRLSCGDVLHLLKECHADVFQAFPQSMPDRVRRNHVVSWLGIRLWCDALGGDTPDCKEALGGSIGTVYNLVSGRARTLVDEFVEGVVNASAIRSIRTGTIGNKFWFQLSSAYEWWIINRKRSGRGSLERDSILTQLKEAPYYIGSSVVDGVWVHSIDLDKAQQVGLDVPAHLGPYIKETE